MPLTAEEVMQQVPDDGASTQRIAHRTNKPDMAIVEYNPEWPLRFEEIKARIGAALGATAVEVHHVGSTSVPGLAAKDIIDIDLVVPDINDEAAYVPALEKTHFAFLLREPAWYEHRFFVDNADRPGSYFVNLHVFGPETAQVERHCIFRDWLRKTPSDVELYARVKRECAAASAAAGESMQEYTIRKDRTIEEIRNRAFRELGWIS